MGAKRMPTSRGRAVGNGGRQVWSRGAMKAGDVLGQYRILEPLGAGGMGEVYRARDERLRRDVAIKVLREATAGNAEKVARLRREAHSLAALNHPNVAAIYGLEETDDVLLLVLELVEGETLQERLRAGPAAVDEALRIGAEIAAGFEAAHERGNHPPRPQAR